LTSRRANCAIGLRLHIRDAVNESSVGREQSFTAWSHRARVAVI
jgi:hypothetical protein